MISTSTHDYNRMRTTDGEECFAAALELLSHGLSVLALCPPDHVGVGKTHAKHCKSPGKAPWGEWREFQDRLPTEDEIRQKWKDNPLLNLGMALGPVSKIVRLDVEGSAAQAELERISGGDLSPTWEFTSGRADGTGRGILYAIPEGVTFKTTPKALIDGELRFQARGAQTVLPPSRHASGNKYAWLPGRSPWEMELAPAPQWMIDRYGVKPLEERAESDHIGSDVCDSEYVAGALRFVADFDDYNQWLKVGMALHDWDFSAGFALWCEWSRQSKEKFDAEVCRIKWDSFTNGNPDGITIRSVFRLAGEAGWIPQDQTLVDLSALMRKASEPGLPIGKPIGKPTPRRAEDPGPFPTHLLDVPGFIGDVAIYTNSAGKRIQPVLALGGAICLLSVLTGRKVQDESGTRPNIYIMAVVESTHGKDTSRETNKKILHQAGAAEMFCDGFHSGSAVISTLTAQPALLALIDEFGRAMRVSTSPNAQAHCQEVVTNYLKLYTSSGSIFKGNHYADSKRNQVINQPHLSIYGSSTVNEFYAALSPESISGGLLGRCLIIEGEKTLPDLLLRPDPPIPESILETARQWVQFHPGGNLASEHPAPVKIPLTREARDHVVKFAYQCDDEQRRDESGNSALWGRAVEKASKLALLRACSVTVGESAVIDLPCVRWATDFIRYVTMRMLFVSSSRVSENNTESFVKKILRIISEAGSITMSRLSRRCQSLTPRERKEAIQTLIESDQIEMSSIPTTGRPSIVLTLKQ